jgi:hypothetical protein
LLVSLEGGASLQLSIIPLDEIRPHERTIPSLLRTIRNDMIRTGKQRDPILVDRKTLLALDGMHRIESLKSLGANYALCAEYDYLSDSVKLERWLRTMIAPSRKLVSTIVSKFEMTPCVSIKTAIRRVETRENGIALLSNRESFLGGESLDVAEIYQKIGDIDALCEKDKVELQFLSESEKVNMFSSESVVVIFPASLSKLDVLRLARRNELLPYKTTKHTVPMRPMGIYFPISYLRKRNLPECRQKLDQIVNFSKVVLERQNTWYEGRRYSERIAIFRKFS